MLCETELLFTTLFHLSGRLYSGQILSSLNSTPTAGKTIGDLIMQIFCEPVNETFLNAYILMTDFLVDLSYILSII